MGHARLGHRDAWTRRSPQPPGGEERRRLVGDLLAGPFQRYARAVRADQESYIPLDEGLSVISKHAKNVLGYDAIVLLLDELVLWLAGYIGDHDEGQHARRRRSPSSSSPPSTSGPPRSSASCPASATCATWSAKAAAGDEVTSLFDTLKYWDGRFDHITLDDRNLPAIVHERLLQAQGRRRQGRARRRVRQDRQRPGRRPGTSCSTRTASKGDRDGVPR